MPASSLGGHGSEGRLCLAGVCPSPGVLLCFPQSWELEAAGAFGRAVGKGLEQPLHRELPPAAGLDFPVPPTRLPSWQVTTGSAWRPQRMADPQREKCETVPELPALSHDPGRDYQLLLPGHSQYPCLDSSQSCSNMFSCSPGPAAQLLVIPVFANPAGSLKGPHCQHTGVDLEQ